MSVLRSSMYSAFVLARNLRLSFVYVLIRLSSIDSLAQFNQIKRKLIKEEKTKSYSLVTKIEN